MSAACVPWPSDPSQDLSHRAYPSFARRPHAKLRPVATMDKRGSDRQRRAGLDAETARRELVCVQPARDSLGRRQVTTDRDSLCSTLSRQPDGSLARRRSVKRRGQSTDSGSSTSKRARRPSPRVHDPPRAPSTPCRRRRRLRPGHIRLNGPARSHAARPRCHVPQARWVGSAADPVASMRKSPPSPLLSSRALRLGRALPHHDIRRPV